MHAGSDDRGTGDQSPPRFRSPGTGVVGTPVQATFRKGPPLDIQEVAFPQQVPFEVAEAEAVKAEAARLLREQISQELWDNQVALRRFIRSRGYREPDLSVLSNETQARYYQARMKPDFAFTKGPWPFLLFLFRRVRTEFHRGQKLVPVPVEDAKVREEAAEDELLHRVNSEAIKVFLEKHLSDPSELTIYLMTYLEDLGPVAIAAQLGIDRKTVTARLRRAEKRLRSAPPDELSNLR